MNKSLLLLTGSLLLGCGAQAASLTPSEALKRVGGDARKVAGIGTTAPVLLRTVSLESGDPALYLFSRRGGDGYLLVSADDVASPLLGYATSGNAKEEALPPQLEWWMSEYRSQIEYARSMNMPAYSGATRGDREAVAPLVKTTWNQNAPFNKECPTVNDRHCPTGCVATAMAQIMKYWNYPEKGTGTGTITLPSTGQRESMNFRIKAFDWDNMLLSYAGAYSTEEADAVAYLMKACGYSVDMNYSLDGSGAATLKAAYAYINNFKYNKNIQFYSRNYFNTTDWSQIIYNELANNRPVLYAGQSTSVGHAFVCDGYDGEGYYHFNWGWGGMSDGYFMLDALNPASVGTGGGTGGGYNFSQEIVVGIQPEATEEVKNVIAQTSELKGTITDGKVTLRLATKQGLCGWYNFGTNACNVNMGVSITPVDGATVDPVYVLMGTRNFTAPVVQKSDSQAVTISYSGWTDKLSGTIPADLPDGKYKMTVCTQNKQQADAPWIPVAVCTDAYNYVLFSKAGNSYKVENMGLAELSLDDAQLLSELYYGCATKLNLIISNNSEKELTQNFYPLLSLAGQLVMRGEGVAVTLQPGETQEVAFTTVFEVFPGASAPSSRQIYNLQFYQPATGLLYDWTKQVTMNVNLANLSVEVTAFGMPDTPVIEEELPNGSVEKIYQVYDKNVIPFSCDLYNPSGFFGYPVLVNVSLGEGGNNVASLGLSPLLTLAAGESGTVSGLLNFSDGIEDEYYCAAPYLKINGRWQALEGGEQIWFKLTAKDTAVKDVMANNGLYMKYDAARKIVTLVSESPVNAITVYALDGMVVYPALNVVSSGVSEINLSELSNGFYLIKAIDAAGQSTTLKVVK